MTKHDRVQVDSILIDQAKCGQALRQAGASNFDLPVALGLQLAYRALEIVLNKPGVGADRLQRARDAVQGTGSFRTRAWPYRFPFLTRRIRAGLIALMQSNVSEIDRFQIAIGLEILEDGRNLSIQAGQRSASNADYRAILCARSLPHPVGRVDTMCSTMCLASRPTPPNNAELRE